ncbi:MATE family efflux transporter [Lichenibacterium dinghuense]|uniref:MATE family efflux transporter n=1 Tax=Lichenibacterium dinghuense TaxID=2895977 RepID=UPI001F26677A|nr:MATE family efflux transporter [Lichenibacterium sp. 6Y81]
MLSSAPPAPAPSWRREIGACAALGLPLVVTNAIEMAINLTDAAFVGRIAPEALAAVTLAMALYNVALTFGIGLTAAVSPLISAELGRTGERGPAARRVVQGGLWNAAAIVGPMWLLLWGAEPVFRALGQEPALARAAAGYLHTLQWGLLPVLVYLVLRSMLAAVERPRWAVMTGALGIVVNAGLNWGLIGGHLGLPALGMEGSALATALSNLFMAAVLASAVLRDPQLRGLRLLRGLGRPPLPACGALWRLGLPIGIGIVLETGAFAATTALVGAHDPSALPAHAIALQVASFAFMVPLGIAQAVSVRVGRAAGARDRGAAARAGWSGLMLGVGAMAVTASLMLAVPGPIIGLFLDPAEPGAAAVVRTATLLLALAGAFQIADGAQVVLAGMLRGLQDTRAPMVIAALGYWCFGVPVAALLAPRYAAPGVWVGLVAGLFAVAAMLLGRWRSRLRPGGI